MKNMRRIFSDRVFHLKSPSVQKPDQIFGSFNYLPPDEESLTYSSSDCA